jgi:hypothetical protein
MFSRQKLRKIIKYLFLAGVCFYTAFDLYLVFGYSPSEKYEILAEIKTSAYKSSIKQLPPNILKAYETVYTGSSKNHVYKDVVWYLLARRDLNVYPQFNLAYEFCHTSKFELLSCASFLDDHLSPKQCISVYLYDFDFLNNSRGIEAAAKTYYNKEAADLSKEECLELMVMTINPAFYNKLTHPEYLRKKTQTYRRS